MSDGAGAVRREEVAPAVTDRGNLLDGDPQALSDLEQEAGLRLATLAGVPGAVRAEEDRLDAAPDLGQR